MRARKLFVQSPSGYSALFKGIVSFHKSPNSRSKNKKNIDESKLGTEKETGQVQLPEAANKSQKAGKPAETVNERQKAGKPAETVNERQKAGKPAQAVNEQQEAGKPAQATLEQAEATVKQPEKAEIALMRKSSEATSTTRLEGATRASAHPQPQQLQKQATEDSQPDYAQAQSVAEQSKELLAQQSQKQVPSPSRSDCAIDESKQAQPPLKQPEIAAKEPELTVKEPLLASSDLISKEELTAQLLENRQARAILEHKLLSVIVPHLPQPLSRPFYLFGLDVTSQPRQFSRTLSSRGFVYHPNAIKGNKPVTIGHQYSLLACLPEKKELPTAPWIVPLSTRRVATDQDKELVGMEQLELLMNDKELPFHNQLCALVGDTSYSKRAFLAAGSQFDNLVTIARVRGNRTFYQKYNETGKPKQGHPTWYGKGLI